MAAKIEGEELLPGLTYGGRGPGGEFYSKDMSDDSISLWTRDGDDIQWTPEELEAIAADMRQRDK